MPRAYFTFRRFENSQNVKVSGKGGRNGDHGHVLLTQPASCRTDPSHLTLSRAAAAGRQGRRAGTGTNALVNREHVLNSTT